jgi:hypothetical protein
MIRNEAWFPLRIWCADKCKLESAFYKKYATLALIINLKTLYLKHPYVVIRVNEFVQRSLLLIKGVEEKKRKKNNLKLKISILVTVKKESILGEISAISVMGITWEILFCTFVSILIKKEKKLQ